MWTTLVFVLVFVGLALGVLFVAMSGGTSGARARLASQSRGTRRLALVNFVLALLILGIAIPAAVIAIRRQTATTSRPPTSPTSRRRRSTGVSCSASAAATATR